MVTVFSGAGDMFTVALSEGTPPEWSRGLNNTDIVCDFLLHNCNIYMVHVE